jgi:hypothetical protein
MDKGLPHPQTRIDASRPSGEWSDDDFDVLAEGVVVGRIFKANAAPVGWMWTLLFGHHEDRTPTHGYAEMREAAMAAFAKSWRQEQFSLRGQLSYWRNHHAGWRHVNIPSDARSSSAS